MLPSSEIKTGNHMPKNKNGYRNKKKVLDKKRHKIYSSRKWKREASSSSSSSSGSSSSDSSTYDSSSEDEHSGNHRHSKKARFNRFKAEKVEATWKLPKDMAIYVNVSLQDYVSDIILRYTVLNDNQVPSNIHREKKL